MINLIKLLLPPIIYNTLKKFLIRRLQKKKNYDPRRWWQGDKITRCYSNEFQEFFCDFYGKIFIINLKNEVKNCVIIKPFQKKFFEFKKDFDVANKILFELGNTEEKVIGSYSVYSNNNKISEIISPSGNEWNRFWIDRKYMTSKFEIINNTQNKMYFAIPRFIYSINNSEKITKTKIL